MAATKTLLALSDTGQTLYAVIRRGADGYFLNDADGAFAAAPSDRYLSLTEDATIKGLYTVAESRTVWDDGRYAVLLYSQTGGTPATASDIPLGDNEMVLEDDAEVSLSSSSDMSGLIAAVTVLMSKNSVFLDSIPQLINQVRLLTTAAEKRMALKI